MTRFYKIPNLIFTYNLSPSAFYLYIHLCNRFYWKQSIRIKLKTLSTTTAMSINTVRSAISELESFKLIKKNQRKHHQSGYTITSEYEIYRLPGSFAMIDSKAFVYLQSDKSSAYIYCAIASYQNSNKKAFPSYRQIRELTGLSRATCINKVNILNRLGMLCRERYICYAGDYGHNNYVTINMKLRIFLFKVIFNHYGRFIVLFEAHEYDVSIEIPKSHNMKEQAKIKIKHIPRTALFSFLQKGGLNFDKPIIDPLKLRLLAKE